MEYEKVYIINGSAFKTSYGSTTDSLLPLDKIAMNDMNNLYLNKIIGEINNVKNNFDKLEKEFRNKVKDVGENQIGKGNGIKKLKSNIDWMIDSMNNILKNSLNQFAQMKK